jgi:hypothetical protein
LPCDAAVVVGIYVLQIESNCLVEIGNCSFVIVTSRFDAFVPLLALKSARFTLYGCLPGSKSNLRCNAKKVGCNLIFGLVCF